MPDDIREAALAYAARGWSVIPIVPRNKQPLVPWRAFQQQAAETAQICAWFERWPRANVAIVTGHISGLVVLDIDPRHGGDQSLTRIETLHGVLPPTVESLTGGGDRHLYFAHAGATLGNRVGLWPGVDRRANGGCAPALCGCRCDSH